MSAETARGCPICRTDVATDGRWRPFCSERCKWVDLYRWLDGHYVIPGEDAVDMGAIQDLVRRTDEVQRDDDGG